MDTLQVINKDPTKTSGEFDDVSKVEKYEISEEAYAKKTGETKLPTVNGMPVYKNIRSSP